MTKALRESETMEQARHLLERGRGTLAPWLLSVFLGLSPVYWLPGISINDLRKFEWIIVLVALALVFGSELLKGRRPFPAGLLGPLGFAGLLLLWVPGLAQANQPSKVSELIFDLIQCFVFFWCFYCLARGGGDIRSIFRWAFVIFVFLAGITLFGTLLNTPDWQSPCLWGDVDKNGLSIKYSTWSADLVFFVPVAGLLFLPAGNRWPSLWKFAAIAGVIIIVGSQFVSGGRTGILSSLLVLAAFTLLSSSRQLAAMMVLAGLLLSIPFLDESCAQHLRLHYLTVPESYLPDISIQNQDDPALRRLDHVSARRIQGYLLGLEKFMEDPLLGDGYKRFWLDNPYRGRARVHNFWLNWAIYTGIAAPLLFLLMVALMLRAGWRLFRDKSRLAEEREAAALLGLILLSGLVISMLEYNIPIGVFRAIAVWWAAAGCLAGGLDRSASSRS